MGLLFVRDDREYVLEPGETLETDLGVLEVPETVEPGDVVETHLGDVFDVRSLRIPDCFEHFERTGAPMLPRDIGLILGETGAGTGDNVLDVGTGTGVLAAALGQAGASVITYERDADFAAVARSNMQLAGVADRVDVREGDALDALAALDQRFDVVTLDTEDAPRIAEAVRDLLVPGGFLAGYCPFVEHARELNSSVREAGFEEVRTIETIQREFDFDERGSRPTTAPVGHTGFLTIARRGYAG